MPPPRNTEQSDKRHHYFYGLHSLRHPVSPLVPRLADWFVESVMTIWSNEKGSNYRGRKSEPRSSRVSILAVQCGTRGRIKDWLNRITNQIGKTISRYKWALLHKADRMKKQENIDSSSRLFCHLSLSVMERCFYCQFWACDFLSLGTLK